MIGRIYLWTAWGESPNHQRTTVSSAAKTLSQSSQRFYFPPSTCSDSEFSNSPLAWVGQLFPHPPSKSPLSLTPSIHSTLKPNGKYLQRAFNRPGIVPKSSHLLICSTDRARMIPQMWAWGPRRLTRRPGDCTTQSHVCLLLLPDCGGPVTSHLCPVTMTSLPWGTAPPCRVLLHRTHPPFLQLLRWLFRHSNKRRKECVYNSVRAVATQASRKIPSLLFKKYKWKK